MLINHPTASLHVYFCVNQFEIWLAGLSINPFKPFANPLNLLKLSKCIIKSHILEGSQHNILSCLKLRLGAVVTSLMVKNASLV